MMSEDVKNAIALLKDRLAGGLITKERYQSRMTMLGGFVTEAVSKPVKIEKYNKVAPKNDSGLITLTKTGTSRLYVILIVGLLVVIYLEGKLFRKVIKL